LAGLQITDQCCIWIPGDRVQHFTLCYPRLAEIPCVVVTPDFQDHSVNLGAVGGQNPFDLIAVNGLPAIQAKKVADRRCPS